MTSRTAERPGAFSSETGRRAEHVRGRRRPSLPEQTSHPHATARRLPPRFPIGEYSGVHSVPTFSRRPFPAPFHFCASRAALSPHLTLLDSFPRPSPSLPFLSFALRRGTSPLFAPALHATRAPVFRTPATAPKSPPPATRSRSLHSRVALFLFLLAPSFTRPAKQAASRLSDSASGLPATRRPPSSGVST